LVRLEPVYDGRPGQGRLDCEATHPAHESDGEELKRYVDPYQLS